MITTFQATGVRRVAAVTLAAAALALGGCSSSTATKDAPTVSSPATSGPTGSAASGSSTTAVSGSITVYAAASLTEAFTQIAKQVEAANPGTTVSLQFGASSELATRITQGAAADVFASASAKNMTAVVGAGEASSPANFAANTLEVAVPPSNPAKVAALADLARSGVKLAVCDAAVPCGVVAAKVFANAKLSVTPVARPADVKSTLALVESGEVDAGLVYVTDVRAAGAKVRGITIPAGVNARTTYPIATLKSGKNAALAQAFVDYVRSDAGQKVLQADGFSAP